MIDQPKTTQLLERLRTYVAELRRLGAIPGDVFLADPDKWGTRNLTPAAWLSTQGAG
jgi:hypothetical protein